MLNSIAVAYLSEKCEGFECKGIGNTGGKSVHTRRLLQEVRGRQSLYIGIYIGINVFQMIIILVVKPLTYIQDTE